MFKWSKLRHFVYDRHEMREIEATGRGVICHSNTVFSANLTVGMGEELKVFVQTSTGTRFCYGIYNGENVDLQLKKHRSPDKLTK